MTQATTTDTGNLVKTAADLWKSQSTEVALRYIVTQSFRGKKWTGKTNRIRVREQQFMTISRLPGFRLEAALEQFARDMAELANA